MNINYFEEENTMTRLEYGLYGWGDAPGENGRA
jgi:hypothetical protein